LTKEMNRALVYDLATARSGRPARSGRAVIQRGYRVVDPEAHALIKEIAAATTIDGARKEYLADVTSVRC
jgi:hypothetical protein